MRRRKLYPYTSIVDAGTRSADRSPVYPCQEIRRRLPLCPFRKGSDKRITSTLAAKRPNPEVVEEITPADTSAQSAQPTDSRPEQSDKSSLVAESPGIYRQREPLTTRIIIGGCGATPPGGFLCRAKQQADNRVAGPKL